MITLNVYVYAVLLQLLILLVLLSAFTFYRVHQLKKTIAQKQGEKDEYVQKPDASQYLATETKLTRGRYEASIALHDGGTSASEESLLYALRADFLDIEHTLADEVERNDAFWVQVEQQLRGLLETHHLSTHQADSPPPEEHALPADTPDTPDTQTALSSQVALIERLKTQVAQEVKDEDTRNLLNAELDALAHSNRELSDCVSMLEEANTFLHNQLRTLADT